MSLKQELEFFLNEVIEEFGSNKVIEKLIVDTSVFKKDGDLMKFLNTFLNNDKRIKFNEIYTLKSGNSLFKIIKKYKTLKLECSRISDFNYKEVSTYDIAALANSFNITVGMYHYKESGEEVVLLKATINDRKGYENRWVDPQRVFKYMLMKENEYNYTARDYKHNVNRLIYQSFVMETELKIYLFVRSSKQKDYFYEGVYSVLSFSNDGKSIRLINNKSINHKDLDENSKSLQVEENKLRGVIEENESLYGERLYGKTRRFQGLFRRKLIEKYKGKCVLCNIDYEEFLVASHIKPYSKCINKNESCDCENGLLLCPNHDFLFDKGYISFDDQGSLLISGVINDKNKDVFLKQTFRKIEISEKTKEYLRYHRKYVYKR